MIVSELIEELTKFKEEHGDLEVVVNADHSQVHMKAFAVCKVFTEDLSQYMSEPIADEDATNHQAVCEVQG